MAKQPRRWIGGAVKKPDALRNYVEDTFGPSGFTRRGTIQPELVKKLAGGVCPVCFNRICTCPTTKTRRRARLAERLRSFG